MKRILSLLAFGIAMSAFVALAQDDAGKGKRGDGKGGNEGAPPLEKVLDANSDGVISSEEIANAPAALKKLDKSGDGKLTADEFRKHENDKIVSPLEKVLDANSDGVISAEEIANAPAALKKLDKNGDGKLAADEFRPPRPEDGEGENKDDEK